MKRVLVGDVGGTNVRFGIGEPTETGIVIRDFQKFPGADVDNFYQALAHYAEVTQQDLSEIARDNARLVHLPALLRRTALAAFPRQEVANLHGSEWVDWLNQQGASFLPDDARWLDQLAYDPQLAKQLERESTTRLIASSRLFIRSHRARV